MADDFDRLGVDGPACKAVGHLALQQRTAAKESV